MARRRVNATKHEIVRVASKLFLETGYSATSPKLVCEELDIIRKNDAERSKEVFKDWTDENFAEAEVLVSGIEYAYAEDGVAATEIVFQNSYDKPVPPPPVAPEAPQTGDHANLGLWFALMFVSGGILFTALRGKKKAEEN